MKVLFIIETLTGGGAERITALLATAFAEQFRYDTCVCIINDSEKEYKISQKVKRIYRSKKSNYKILDYVYRYCYIRKVMRKEKPDYVISLAMFNTIFLISAGSIFRKYKIIYSERNDPRMFPKSGLKKMLRNYSYYMSDGLVLQTEYVKNLLPEYCLRRTTVIPNPVEIKDFKYIDNKDKIIINCSRLTEQKNLKLLIDSFKDIHQADKECKLQIYGDGPLRSELLNYSKKIGVDEFVEIIPYCDDVMSKMLKASVYVSTSNYEGISNSVLEALSIGLPTIATDCPVYGMREIIVNNYNGILVPMNDKTSIVNAVVNVLNNRSYASFLGENARKRIQKYTTSNIAKLWVEFMMEAAK